MGATNKKPVWYGSIFLRTWRSSWELRVLKYSCSACLLFHAPNPAYILSRVLLGRGRHMPACLPTRDHQGFAITFLAMFVRVSRVQLSYIRHTNWMWFVYVHIQCRGGNCHNLNECHCLLYTSLCTLSIILRVQMLVKASTAPWLTRPLVWRPLVCLGWPWLLYWTEPREICPRNQTSELLWWQQWDSQSRQTSLPGDRKTVVE